MGPETTQVLRVDTASPRQARNLVRSSLSGRPCASVAELAVSELVSNVVRHAPDVTEMEVTLRADENTVRIEVAQTAHRDGFPKYDAAKPWPDASRIDGRGLRVVDAVSRNWGVADDSKTIVWCEIDC